MITLNDLSKQFDEKIVLDNINLTFSRGKTTAIIGPSGSGKTTLLRSLNLLETPTSGQLTVGDWQHDFSSELPVHQKKVLELRQKLGMVFQSFNLFPHRTVAQNITEGPIVVQKKNPIDALQNAYTLLEKVGLRDKAGDYPHQLSGGQKQRVAIARALAMEPELLLFDEPTSALDAELEREVLRVIKALANEGNTQIIVTHNLDFARSVAHEIVFIEEGHIIEACECKQFFDSPKKERTKKFLANANASIYDDL